MSDHAATIRAFWQATSDRDWAGVAATLSPDVVYEMEQTRERVLGRDAFLRFFAEFPGGWRLVVRRVIADEGGGVAVLDFVLDDEAMTGISFFGFDVAGLVDRIDDVWPEAYEPPTSRAHLTERF